MNQIRSLLVLVCALVGVPAQLTSAQDVDVLIDLGDSQPQAAQMISPSNAAPLSSPTVQFQWSAGSQVQGYWMWIGTAPNGSDLVTKSMGLETSLSVAQLPINGRTLYVTLWSFVGGQWKSYSYQYATVAPSATAQIISPADGSTLPGSTVTFTWTAGTGAQQYWLYLGSQQYGNNLFSQSAGLNTSFTFQNLPTAGQPLFLTLWTLAGGQWKYNSYHYVAGAVGTTQVVPGLRYDYYEKSDFTALPNFAQLTAVKTGTIGNFDLAPRNRTEWIAFQFTGYVRVDVAGSYTFFTSSDDGSQLFIDGALVVNNDGFHGVTEKSGQKDLTAGYHEITVTFFQGAGTFGLEVNWAGPGIAKQHIPNDRLFRRAN